MPFKPEFGSRRSRSSCLSNLSSTQEGADIRAFQNLRSAQEGADLHAFQNLSSAQEGADLHAFQT
ncbi:hypothetical protein VY732_12785 [Pseudomonas sp. ZY71]|uniref:hypothetical protein n=1 Tax=Pseudomonas sp. ZY71 TaxID=3115647 RepID=UPI002F42BACB